MKPDRTKIIESQAVIPGSFGKGVVSSPSAAGPGESQARRPWYYLRAPESITALYNRAFDAFRHAASRRSYERLFYWGLVFSLLTHLSLAYLIPRRIADESQDVRGSEVLQLNPHTLVVVNAVARTSLAKRRVKVPKLQEVEFAVKEIEIPDPELGSLDIGPDVPVDEGAGPGSPTGKARVRRPELVLLVPPVYPRDAEKKRAEGTVVLRIHVTNRGTVDQVEVVTSSGFQSMDEAAVKAAQKTRFRPAIRNGVLVDMWINYPIEFALNQKK